MHMHIFMFLSLSPQLMGPDDDVWLLQPTSEGQGDMATTFTGVPCEYQLACWETEVVHNAMDHNILPNISALFSYHNHCVRKAYFT